MTELLPLEDARGSFATFREAFGLDNDSPWELPFRVFAARLDDAVVLVDTGVGPPGEEPFLPARQARLPAELQRIGLRPEDVDLVVFTHLHPDHAGWNMVDGAPFFANARYVAHRADYEWFSRARNRPYVRDQVIALHDAGRLELVDADGSPHPGVTITHSPGHTPGHCLVAIGDVLVLGDTVVHELQLANPDLAYDSESDQPQVAAERRRLLPQLAESGQVVALGHLPGGLGRISREGAAFAWSPLD
jgi:glyoxylase-like metal-dependent hydrolase (beta-lactamase superfamily II)